MDKTLGKRIVSNRKRLGMTQDQLAEHLGVTAQAVSKWENDQSCPDINILPKLADIFCISTDELLGHETHSPVPEAEVLEASTQNSDGLHIHKGNWNFYFDSSRKNAIWLAIFVLSFGTVYLLSGLFNWGISFWGALWSTALLVFGLSGLFPRFSFLRFGCVLLSVYFLISNSPFNVAPFDNKIIFAGSILLFGLSLLWNAFKKSKKPTYNVTYTDKIHSVNESHTDLTYDENSFSFSSSFGESTQFITLPLLEQGNIDTKFGDYAIDLSGIDAVADTCHLHAACKFGDLTIKVPQRFKVKAASSTAFADFHICGSADESPEGSIYLDAQAVFGEIKVLYI